MDWPWRCGYLGQYDEAGTIHERCLAIARQFQDRYGEWTHLVNLGNIRYELGDFETAVARYEEALIIPKQLQAPRGISMTLNNLGQARRGQQQFEAALACFDEALQINREHGFRSGEGHALNGRGLTLVEAAQFEAAAAVLTEAVAIWRELDDRLRLLDALASLALAQVGLKQTGGPGNYRRSAGRRATRRFGPDTKIGLLCRLSVFDAWTRRNGRFSPATGRTNQTRNGRNPDPRPAPILPAFPSTGR
jgi:tetratricopeptide (TPR) repeat protein